MAWYVPPRRGLTTAEVAVARKLLTMVYAMLKKNEPFRRRSPVVASMVSVLIRASAILES